MERGPNYPGHGAPNSSKGVAHGGNGGIGQEALTSTQSVRQEVEEVEESKAELWPR
jgi:hypothetical protein